MTDTTPPDACPFCGNVPPKTIHETRFGEGYLQCACCEARGPTSFAEALTAWNTRANADARLVEALEALEPFVCGYTQFPESAKIISKAMDGMTPVSVTVTKAQFLRAITACLALKDTDHG